MSENYKLTYFNLRAVGEPVRLVFAFAGVKYEDIRVTHEEWPQIKKNYPHGQLPVLEMNGNVLAQSNAICRFLGQKYGLHGSNEWEAAKIDETADLLTDFRLGTAYNPVHREEDPAKKEQLKKKFVENNVSIVYGKLNKLIAENKQGLFLVGNKTSWVDLMAAHYMELYSTFLTDYPDIMDSYPHLERFKKSVFELPQIKAWVAKRPQTPF